VLIYNKADLIIISLIINLFSEATHTNIKAFGLTRPGLESTMYRIRGELAINYATDPVTSSINMKVNGFVKQLQ
jgi:hypothetical protein